MFKKTSGLFDKLKGKPKEKKTISRERVYQLTVNEIEALQGAERKIAVGEPGNSKLIEVQIPKGVKNGEVVRFSTREGFSEPIKAKVTVTEHPFIERRGEDVLLNLPITLKEALLGAEVFVPTFAGKIKLNLSPILGPIKILRIPGRGPAGQDLFVRPKIALPDKSSSELRALLLDIDKCYVEAPEDRFVSHLGSK